MSEVFLKLVNLSISASWLVLAVVVLRLLLKKAPKWISVLLWGIVAVRLLCPISVESVLSLIPSSETIPLDIGLDTTPTIHSGIPALNSVINPMIQHSNTPAAGDSVNPLQITLAAAANIWVLGAGAMLLYTAVSYLRIRKKLTTATVLRRDVYQSETVSSPFVLGLIRPRIYLPYNIASGDLTHVLAHEQAHIRRKDHWWKPLGFLLLALHWFNPMMWLAYILLCRDIELACDEKVIASLEHGKRADYTQALVACSVGRRMIAACPLAFGEVGVKDRVKSIMNYRKPAFWIVVASVAVCAAAAVCFLTDPTPSPEFSMSGTNVRNLDVDWILDRIYQIEDADNSNVYINANNASLMVDSGFNWVGSQTIWYSDGDILENHGTQLLILPHEKKYMLTESSASMDLSIRFLLRFYLEALKYLPQEAIRQIAPADRYTITHIENGRPSNYDRVITYSSEGIQEIDGWFIHLRIQPLHADGEQYRGTEKESIELFYGSGLTTTNACAELWFDFTDAPEQSSWIDGMERTDSAFPGVTFIGNIDGIMASSMYGNIYLTDRMLILSAYFYDLTGDGFPEICCQARYGCRFFDNRVVVIDYANGMKYELEDYGDHDYFLHMHDDGYLYVDKRALPEKDLIFSEKLEFKDGTIQAGGDKAVASVTLYAKVLEIYERHYLVEPVAGSRELNTADRIEVPMKNTDLSPEPSVGDILQIEYDGQIQESYPARIPNVHQIRVVQQVQTTPKSMIPTDTDLQGLHAGALLLPIDGKTYRYLLTDRGADGIAVGEPIHSFTEPGIHKNIDWVVYSLTDYRDLSVVLLASQTDGAWLCQYSPPGRCSDTALAEAIAAGNAVMEDGYATHGKDVWRDFFDAARQGKPAFVTVAHYQTLDEARCDTAYCEAFRQDYPYISVYHLSFDGKIYTLSFSDGDEQYTRTFEYLMAYSDFGSPVSSQLPPQRYVLTHDDKVTWEQLFRGMTSSQAGAYIDHFTVYVEKQG